MTFPLIAIEVKAEHDIVLARQRARRVASLAGFDGQDQTRIATVVSELARNAYSYARGGRVELALQEEPPAIVIKVSDRGGGIANLEEVLSGRYRSETGMGLGLIGARRIMDVFRVDTSEQGTTVLVEKHLPAKLLRSMPAIAGAVANALAKDRPSSALEEVQLQNREILSALELLRDQKERLEQANRELEDTNRGVVALLAELDERAGYLKRANELKTSFLSNMTHEFRTPLNSILSLSRILLDRLDGPLTPEQEKQVTFIRRAADGLSDLVNDLLDLAKVEAGKILLRPTELRVSELFSALRGMLRPLLAHNTSVSLNVEDPEEDVALYTDEAKLSQILRNFISNALKFTENGAVQLSVRRGEANTVIFSVSDTGIGIAPEDQERIFEEFTQLETPLHHRSKGTGLGLPLSRRLAGLLGGSIHVTSELGKGSTFSLVIPARIKGPSEVSIVPELSRQLDPMRAPVLVVEDNRESLFIYEKYLRGSGYQVLPSRTIEEAREWLRSVRPVAIILDVLLESTTTWSFLETLKREAATRDIPVIVATMVENETRARALGADAFAVKPVERTWLVERLEELTGRNPQLRALVIDDDEISRYLLRGLLSELQVVVFEAAGGAEGVLRAQALIPDIIFLDISMPDLDGYGVLAALGGNEKTARVPVIIYTGSQLSSSDRQRLAAASAIVPKESASRGAALASLRAGLEAAGVVRRP